MPFTLAHPAAAVPLRRLFGGHPVLSALLIGSLTPDAVYFLPLPVSQPASHSLGGLLWFCLPVGLAAWVVFHRLMKVPLAALLPVAIQERLPPLRPAPPEVPAPVLVLALVAGAATHVALDAFTHAETLPVQALPWLRTHLFTIADHEVAVWTLLQHVSTVAGLALLTRWALHWLRAAPVVPQPHVPRVPEAARMTALVLLLVATTGAALAGVLHAPPQAWTFAELHVPVRRAIVAGLQAAGAATLGLSLCWLVAGRRTACRTIWTPGRAVVTPEPAHGARDRP